MNNPSPNSTLIGAPLKSNNKILLIAVGLVVLCCCCLGFLGSTLAFGEMFLEALSM
ncbi:MAG: hypothetical protein RBS68_06665 [Anaerolineales bacterium]|nr:hypothetical protein [Anaerolineales bacterium]